MIQPEKNMTCLTVWQGGHDSGTMLAYGTGPMPGRAPGMAGAEATVTLGSSMSPSGTFVLADAQQQGADYQAAVQAAAEGSEGYANCVSLSHCYVYSSHMHAASEGFEGYVHCPSWSHCCDCYNRMKG